MPHIDSAFANQNVATSRKHTSYAIAATDSSGTTGVIDFRHFAGGSIEINQTAGTVSSITWYAKNAVEGSSISAASDEAGNAIVTSTADNEWIEIPKSLFSASFLYPVLNSSAAATLYVSLKS